MLRGVPVMAANVGGIPEAMMGVPYLLPVRPIEKYETRLDEQMVPVAEVPAQDIEPWREALERLLPIARTFAKSRGNRGTRRFDYASSPHGGPFENLLKGVVEKPAAARLTAARSGIRGAYRRRSDNCWRCGCARKRRRQPGFPAPIRYTACAFSAFRTPAAGPWLTPPGTIHSFVRFACRAANRARPRLRSNAWHR